MTECKKKSPKEAAKIEKQLSIGDSSGLTRLMETVTKETSVATSSGYHYFTKTEWRNEMMKCGASLKESNHLWSSKSDRTGKKYIRVKKAW